MLSICIPIFNFEIGPLVEALFAQAKELNIGFEILLWEDGSEELYKEKNRFLREVDRRIQYRELPFNIGRSKIRNELAAAAQYEQLLFLDGDAEILNDQFLANYLSALAAKIPPFVICGGRVYPTAVPPRAYRLHWTYGTKRESQAATVRQQNPNAAFMTNNFLVSKSIFSTIQFNEVLQGYGHEDTLFGWELQKMGIQIIHIENPVCHIGLEENKVFLNKTKEGVANLFRLHQLLAAEGHWYKDIKLMNAFMHLKKRGLARFAFSLFKPFEPLVQQQLDSDAPFLWLFNGYKLWLLLREDRDS
ncbi:MAG: glycosyltransferase [Saprospiraceae bacterium]